LITDKSIICNEITYFPYNTNCISKQDLLVKNGIPDKPCNDHHIIILPNGTTFPCCNVGWSDTLILGNAKESSLSELLQNYNRSSLLAILQETGPSYFVPKLRENNIPIPDNSFVNECHLCHEILSNLKATEIIRALTYQWERDKISFIESLVGTE
jgi:hypothetical protein